MFPKCGMNTDQQKDLGRKWAQMREATLLGARVSIGNQISTFKQDLDTAGGSLRTWVAPTAPKKVTVKKAGVVEVKETVTKPSGNQGVVAAKDTATKLEEESKDLQCVPKEEHLDEQQEKEQQDEAPTQEVAEGVAEEPQEAVEEPQEAAEEPQEKIEEPQEAVEEPQEVGEEPQEAIEEPQEAVEEPQKAVEEEESKEEKETQNGVEEVVAKENEVNVQNDEEGSPVKTQAAKSGDENEDTPKSTSLKKPKVYKTKEAEC